MTVGGSADIQLNDLDTGRRAQVARLSLRPSVFELAADPNQVIYLASYFGSSAMDFTVVEVEIQPPIRDFIDRAFATAYTGDLAGYATQVKRIANRNVPMSSLSESRLNELYNDAHQHAYDQLTDSFTKSVADYGLYPSSPPDLRSIDGWPPPEYGGGASRPMWQLPNTHDGPWLEAAIGVSHRAWPTTNLNDLVVTLIFRMMSDDAQHTFLTRFVPFEAGDPTLPHKVQDLLAEVTALLPGAIDTLRAASDQASPTAGC